jgi:hypothetical protein
MIITKEDYDILTIKKGDIIINGLNEYKVLGVCDDIIFTTSNNQDEDAFNPPVMWSNKQIEAFLQVDK